MGGGLGLLGWFFTPSPLSLSLQFTLVGVFGETPEPAVAVDAISTAPCGGENKALGGPDRSELGAGWGVVRNREHGPRCSHLPF